MKKILALVCSVAMLVSMFAITTNAAVEGATATLEFIGYETAGTAENPVTFAKIAVKATIPDTLVPYEVVPADWVETFEDSYKGLMVQTVGFEIPNIEGFSYVASKSTAASYVQIQDDKTNNKISVYAANTGAYDTYYAGEVDVLATLCYRITGDATATYNLALSNAVIGLADVQADGTVVPREYTFADFAVTNATVKPAEPEKEWVAQEAISAKAGTYKNYEDVVVLTVDVALDEAAEKYGFDLTNGTDTKAFELTGLAGEGSVEYVVAFWGVPSDVTITATPRAYK